MSAAKRKESEMTQRERPNIRARITQKQLLVAPGVFDGISAKIADQMDFEALYMTGYGTVASHLGLPDAGIATYTDMVSRVAVIAGGSKTPLIADGDTGYGGLLNVQYAVRGYAAAAPSPSSLRIRSFRKSAATCLAAASCRSRTWSTRSRSRPRAGTTAIF
jgi:isocitrate lyase